MSVGGLQPLYSLGRVDVNETTDNAHILLERLEAEMGRRVVWHHLSPETQGLLLEVASDLDPSTPRRVGRAYAYGGLFVSGAWIFAATPALAITDAGVDWGLVAFMLGVFGIMGAISGWHLWRNRRKAKTTWSAATMRARLQELADRVDTDLTGRPG